MNDSTKRPLLGALAELRDVPARMGQADDEARRRTRIALHIAATQDTWERKTKRRKVTALLLAVALSLGGWLAFWLQPGATPRVATVEAVTPTAPTVQPELEVLSGHVSVAPGSMAGANTWTAQERSRVRLGGEVELELAPSTELRVRANPGAGRDVEVVRGQVSVLDSSGDAEVRVHTESVRIDSIGASFTVSFMADDTEVAVDSGQVRLQRPGWSRDLRSGERWEHRSEPAPAASLLDAAATNQPAAERAEPTLTEQNRLFQTALLAKQRGLDSLALSRLDELLARYPRGAHSENARVERFRILQRSGAARPAREAARKYVALYPHGFARQEAERLLQSK